MPPRLRDDRRLFPRDITAVMNSAKSFSESSLGIMYGNFLMFVASASFASVACLAAEGVASQPLGDCGNPFQNAYGPFDYRTATGDQKTIVEAHHFTSEVESLHAGITGSIGAEIDYTLRAFPNHPRALMAMI